MRTENKLETVFQLRLSMDDKTKLAAEAHRLGLCESALLRLCLKTGLLTIRRKLQAAKVQAEQ